MCIAWHLLTLEFAAHGLFDSWCDEAVSTDLKDECMLIQREAFLLLHVIL